MLFFPKRGAAEEWWDTLFKSGSGVSPILALDFVGDQYMADAVEKTFSGLTTFTRASTALFRDNSGVFQSASSGAKRLDHDEAGVPLGIRIDPTRQNICLWSDDLTNAAWDTVTNITPLKDETGADGISNSASSLLATANNGVITQAITASSAIRIYSVFIKRLVGTGTIEITTNGGTNWADVTSEINSSDFLQVATASRTVTNPVVGFRIGTDTDKIAVQYCQSEVRAGAHPAVVSSPIPTTTVAVTRAAEVLRVASSDWAYVEATGAFVCHAVSDDQSSSQMHPFEMGTFIDAQTINKGGGTSSLTYLCKNNSEGGISCNFPGGSVSNGVVFKVGIAWALDDFEMYVDGASVGTDTLGVPPDVADMANLNIGCEDDGDSQITGYVKFIVQYPSRLDDSDMNGLTTL